MSYFTELEDMTTKILELLYNDQELMRLLKYDSTAPLDDTPLQPDVDGSSLVFERLFPLPKNADTLQDEGSVINVYLVNSKLQSRNKGHRNDIIAIEVIVNLDNWRLDDGLRPYKMLSIIDKKFNNQFLPTLSINTVLFSGVSHIAFSSGYHGYRVLYKMSNTSNIECKV